MRIAFIGCDGSGKTTLAKTLIRTLKKRGFKCNYKHQYNYFISNTLGKKIRKIKKIKKYTDRRKLLYRIWIFVVYPNLLFNWFLRKITNRNGFSISDRYVYDLMVGWDLQGRLNPLSRFLLENFPKPDKVFLIDAKAETLHKRRGHEYPSFEFCKRKRELYREFAKKINIKIISTENNVETCIKEIMKTIGSEL